MIIETYGSLFAGVGGIDLGLDAAGLECQFQVEIDDTCQQILSYHWPKVPKYGDIKEVSGFALLPVDIVTFGSPCQDLSVAGKKQGLLADRSSLFYEAIRIIKEMRQKTNGKYPRFAIWENVTGALSSNGGNDFEAVLKEMAGIGSYHLEWTVLDAQQFGIPQRRRRVFVISILDPAISTRCGSQIFTFGTSCGGDIEKSKEKIKNNSESTSGSFGKHSSETESVKDLVVAFSHTQGLDPQASLFAWPTLRAGGHGHAVSINNLVRRLTPVECERLMGWPDNHTLYRIDGKMNSDSIRYQMCGNGVASPTVEWIAKKIKEV